MFSARRAAIAVSALALAVLPAMSGTAQAAGIQYPAQPAGHTVAAPTTDANGYAWLNYFRGIGGEGAVTRNAGLENSEAVHVRYLANKSLSCETNVHDELTTRQGNCGRNPAATAVGKAAANNSNVTRVSADVSDRVAMSNWFSSAFHALVLLDPRQTTTGYASYYTAHPAGAQPMAWPYTAAVDVYRGLKGRYSGQTLAFPATNGSTPLLSYQVGTESPEPFQTTSTSSPCHSWGSRSVVSSPVIVQWSKSRGVPAGAASIVDLTTGRAQSTCGLTARSYPSDSLPYLFLDGANGITRSGFYYAATPFQVGHRYQLRIGGHSVTTFTASSVPTAPAVRVAAARKAGTVRYADGTPAGRHLEQVFADANCSGGVVRQAWISGGQAMVTGLASRHTMSVRVAAYNSSGGARWSSCRNFRPA